MNDPPPPLDYRTPDQRAPRDPDAPKRFAWGLIGGTAVSAVVYFAGWHWFPNVTFVLGFIITGAKALAFIGMPSSRGLGPGILASIPLGALIFFGTCAKAAFGP